MRWRNWPKLPCVMSLVKLIWPVMTPGLLVSSCTWKVSLCPAAAAEFIWIEGEDSPDSNFNQHPWYQNEADIRRALGLLRDGPSPEPDAKPCAN